MRYTLTLAQSGPFCQNPRFVELDGEKIALNNVILPKTIDSDGGYNPYNVRLFVIGHEFGAICAIWASNWQGAFDEACDANLIDCLMSENQDFGNEELTPLGNVSELFDLSHAWIGEVEFDAARDIQLVVSIVRAVENQKSTVGQWA
jgi:hypothetical protein